MKESIASYGYEALEAALRYRRELGWSVIPTYPPIFGDSKSGKKSIGLWKDQAKMSLTENEIGHRFDGHRDAGVAVICGQVSNLVAVDGDSPEAIHFIRSELPVTPLISRTGRGEHHFYKWPGFIVPPGAKLKGMALDLRGDGSYVVAPPSRHWSGKNYQWVFEPTKEMLKDLPPFDPSWLDEPRKFKSSTIEPSAADPVKRAALYISRIEGAISGSGGHAVTMRVAGILIQKFGLSIDQAMPLFIMWNTKCSPAWSERELVHKLEDAVKNMASQKSTMSDIFSGKKQ